MTIMVSLDEIMECLKKFIDLAKIREERICLQSAVNELYRAQIEEGRLK